MNDPSERREHPRIEVEWPITLYCDDELIEGASRNITADGILAIFRDEIILVWH